MAGQACKAPQPMDEIELEQPEGGEHGVESRRIMTLRREVEVSCRAGSLRQSHLAQKNPRDEIDAAEARPNVTGSRAGDHVQSVDPACGGEGCGLGRHGRGQGTDPAQLRRRDVAEIGHPPGISPATGGSATWGSVASPERSSSSAYRQSRASLMSNPSSPWVKNGISTCPAIVRPSKTTRDQAISRLAFWAYTSKRDWYWLECHGCSAGPIDSSGSIRRPRMIHIFPGCCLHFSTARRESTPVSARNSRQARWIVAGVRKGLVGRRMLKHS